MAVLVIAEHDNRKLEAATRSALTAAGRFEGPVDLLVAGSDCDAAVACASSEAGVGRVIHVDAGHYASQLPETLALLVRELAPDYSHILGASTTFGKSLLPRVAALLDVAPITDVVEIIDSDTFVRPAYAGNVLETLRSHDAVRVVGVRQSAFSPSSRPGPEGMGATCEVVRREAGPAFSGSRLIEAARAADGRPGLSSARVVVGGGRGLGSAEAYHDLLGALTDRMNGALAASRAAVDAGYVTNDLQVGQTGKIIAPDVYFAVGISGSMQHVAGVKDARVIVSINKDPGAPIHQVANYALVSDLFDTLPELLRAIDEEAQD